MQSDRRKLLLSLALTSVATALGVKYYDSRPAQRPRHQGLRGHLIGGRYEVSAKVHTPDLDDYDVMTSQRRAFRLDLTTGRFEDFAVKTPIHSLKAHPLDAQLALGCSRRGRWMSLVDWRAGREVRSLQLPKGQLWYGHVEFTPDGRYALAPTTGGIEMAWQGQRINAISVLDLEKWQIVDEIPSLHGRMHDIAWAEGHRYISLAAPSTRIPRLVSVDFAQRKVEPLEITFGSGGSPIRVGDNAGHLRLIGGEVYFMISAHEEGEHSADGIWMRYPLSANADHGSTPQLIESCGELLSLDVDARRQRVWMTAPGRKLVKVYDTETRDLIKLIELPEHPQSVQLIPDLNVALIGTREQICVFDTEKFRRLEQLEKRWRQAMPNQLHHSHTELV
ncbi:MAG TPA: DUF1513 domain-containing protein [Pseudobdellovibrionaceae bacterium]|nr:DUF1513 domain-containing protein [Pseudobdellovibrionaceae bacterium]